MLTPLAVESARKLGWGQANINSLIPRPPLFVSFSLFTMSRRKVRQQNGSISLTSCLIGALYHAGRSLKKNCFFYERPEYVGGYVASIIGNVQGRAGNELDFAAPVVIASFPGPSPRGTKLL